MTINVLWKFSRNCEWQTERTIGLITMFVSLRLVADIQLYFLFTRCYFRVHSPYSYEMDFIGNGTPNNTEREITLGWRENTEGNQPQEARWHVAYRSGCEHTGMYCSSVAGAAAAKCRLLAAPSGDVAGWWRVCGGASETLRQSVNQRAGQELH